MRHITHNYFFNSIRIGAFCLVAILCGAQVAHADWDAALKALQAGDHKTAVTHLQPLVDKKDTRALTAYAGLLEKGFGVDKDPEKAIAMYQAAADQNHAGAQLRLGMIFLNGEFGQTKDQKKAAAMLEKAAAGKLNMAQYEYGRLLLSDDLGKADLKKGFGYIRDAARNNFPPAMTALVSLYMNGQGVKQDQKKALFWLEKAADAKIPLAALQWGQSLEKGEGAKKNLAKAAGYYRHAANAGLLGGAYKLGRLYLRGDGIVQDPIAGIAWLELAAEQNFVPAMLELGQIYIQGDLVKKDYQKAANWYEKGAEQGDPRAVYNHALMLERGLAAEKNIVGATEWFKLSADLGNIQAQQRLAQLSFAQSQEADADPAYLVTAAVYGQLARMQESQEVEELLSKVTAQLSDDQKAEVEKQVSGWKMIDQTEMKERIAAAETAKQEALDQKKAAEIRDIEEKAVAAAKEKWLKEQEENSWWPF